MKKYKYSVNHDNQLLIRLPRENKPRPAGGRFDIDKHNRLVYWLNKPDPWRREYKLPNKITFRGNWQLNHNHDLELALDKTERQFQDDILSIKGSIISVDRDILAFEIKTYDREGLLHIQILKLSIFWMTDETNRLKFTVRKREPNIVSLEGSWQVNNNQQIIYTYERIGLKRRARISNTLTFEGYWQINSANKLTYILKNSSDSRFDFRAQIESPTIYPQKGLIKYRLGAGIRKDRLLGDKTIFLYGTWKISRRAGLIFQMDYGKKYLSRIEFGAEIALNQRDKITFTLNNVKGEPLGINVTFSRKFLKTLEAEAFLRLKTLKQESRLESGVSIPF